MTKGLYLGKFMPLHEGHLLVIKTAATLVDDLVVLVCSLNDDPIDGMLRYRWVTDSVPDNVTVRWHSDPMPQLPEDDVDFWPKWKSLIHSYGRFDKVFGGEDYVLTLGIEINAEPVPLGRDLIKISASKIRANPYAHWKHVPSVVRPYYRKRVTLLGPESTGKTTLSNQLQEYFGDSSCVVPEYGRTYDETLKKGADWNSDDFLSIATIHAAMRSALLPSCPPIVIEDTDFIQTMAWENQLTGSVTNDYSSFDSADLYLLLTPEVPWIDDGTRYGEKHRDSMLHYLRTQLSDRKLNYQRIQGSDWHTRYNQAVAAIEKTRGRTTINI